MAINNLIGSGSGGANPSIIPPGTYQPQNTNQTPENLINYNEKFKTSGDILHREEEIKQTLSILLGKMKPNALLIGPAGVGKTKIVEAISYLLATGSSLIPKQLKNKTIYELPLSSIVAGAGIVGQLEKNVQEILEFFREPKNNAILFIDEIHLLMSRSNTYETISQILKPALSRGEILTIGATTLQESKSLLSDPAFNRRFSSVIVSELSACQTADVIEQILPSFKKHYRNITVNPSIVPHIIQYADDYKKASQHRPDNAITLLDRAMADSIILRKELEQKAQNDPVLLQSIQSSPIVLNDQQLKTTAERLAGKKEAHSDANLRERLKVVRGQDAVIEPILRIIKEDSFGFYPKEKPLTFLFAGKSGVGKTMIAKIIAEELTGNKPIILNMSEYHSSSSINRIIGSPPGYVGSDSNQEMPFDILESNPNQLILLDEFEKADISVQRLFMSAFEEGVIRTSKNTDIDFSKAIIIATTNAGTMNTKSNPIGFGSKNEANLSSQINDLSHNFDRELLNRFTLISTFNALPFGVYRDILKDVYEEDIRRIKSTRRIAMPDTLEDAIATEIAEKTYIADFGARPAKKAIKEYILSNV